MILIFTMIFSGHADWEIVNVVGQASGEAVNDGYAVNNGQMTANTGLDWHVWRRMSIRMERSLL